MTLIISISAILILLLLLVIWIISVRNEIVEYDNKVKRSWSDVLVYEQQKNKIIPKLENIVKNFENYEKDFQSKIVKLRTLNQELSEKNIDLDKLKEVEDNSEQLMKSLNVTVENYPELKADQMFNNLMIEIVEQQENISSAIRIFNSNVERFNTNIEIFPNNVVNDKCNKKKAYPMFKTEEKSEIGFSPY